MEDNLPKVDFSIDDLKLDILYEDKEYLTETQKKSLQDTTPEKVKEIFGDLFFPIAQDEFPHVYASFVFSMDGKIGFPDNPEGPLVSSKNFTNPKGGKADFWLLIVLRTFSDVAIRGAKTLAAEEEGTGHIFDDDLIDIRKDTLNKSGEYPINLIVSLDGTDIPLDHKVFNIPNLKVWINTSPKGVQYLKENWDKNMKVLYGDQDVNWEKEFKSTDYNEVLVICTGEDKNTNAFQLLKALKSGGMDHVTVESPSYTWYLLKKQLLDEMFINYSGLYIGGDMTFGLNNPFSSEEHPHIKLVKLSMHNSTFLYTRQKILYNN